MSETNQAAERLRQELQKQIAALSIPKKLIADGKSNYSSAKMVAKSSNEHGPHQDRC